MAELGKVVQDQVHAPFTDEALKNIKAWQAEDIVHELTCPRSDELHGTDMLTPLPLALICTVCGYTQDWVPLAVADGSGLKEQKELIARIKSAVQPPVADEFAHPDVDECLKELQELIDANPGRVLISEVKQTAISARNIFELMRKEHRRLATQEAAFTNEGLAAAAQVLGMEIYNDILNDRAKMQDRIAGLERRVDELLRANNALIEDRRMRDVALTKAAETFDFYAGHHREKLNANLDPRLTAALKDKVDRNVDRAAMCRAARDHRTVPANG